MATLSWILTMALKLRSIAVVNKCLFDDGPQRQFGSGAAGLVELAVRVGRSTLPLLKRYVLPVAKELGQHFISTIIPEQGNERQKDGQKTVCKEDYHGILGQKEDCWQKQ